MMTMEELKKEICRLLDFMDDLSIKKLYYMLKGFLGE